MVLTELTTFVNPGTVDSEPLWDIATLRSVVQSWHFNKTQLQNQLQTIFSEYQDRRKSISDISAPWHILCILEHRC